MREIEYPRTQEFLLFSDGVPVGSLESWRHQLQIQIEDFPPRTIGRLRLITYPDRNHSPTWIRFLRLCSLIPSGTDYRPRRLDVTQPRLTLKWKIDGALWELGNVMGDVKIEAAQSRIPEMTFDLVGDIHQKTNGQIVRTNAARPALRFDCGLSLDGNDIPSTALNFRMGADIQWTPRNRMIMRIKPEAEAMVYAAGEHGKFLDWWRNGQRLVSTLRLGGMEVSGEAMVRKYQLSSDQSSCLSFALLDSEKHPLRFGV